MAVFFRPGFKAGVMMVKDRDADGKEITRIMKAQDNGKDFAFTDEAFVAANYPQWITDVEGANKKKNDRRKSKERREKQIF